MSRRQAVTIARTETLRAANQGRNLGYAQAQDDYGIEMSKRWVSNFDSRTREDHMEMMEHQWEITDVSTICMEHGERLTFTLEQRQSEGVGFAEYVRPDILREWDRKLAAYEDSGLSPERVAELAQALTRNCDTCKWRDTYSYKYYSYPCRECKYRARDSYERRETNDTID